MMKKKEVAGVAVRCLVALTLFTVAIIYYDELKNIDVKQLVSGTDNTAVISAIILGVYFVKALVFVVPASAVYVAVGGIFSSNLLFAVILNLLGIFTEVTVTYILGRFLGRDAVNKLLSGNAAGRKILKKNIGDKASILVSIRAIPVFPIDFVSLFYGASGCRYLKYSFLSVAGISWRVILFTIIGDAIFKWIPMDKIILAVICLIPVGVIYYLIKKFVVEPKKKAKETAEQKENTASAGTETAEN